MFRCHTRLHLNLVDKLSKIIYAWSSAKCCLAPEPFRGSLLSRPSAGAAATTLLLNPQHFFFFFRLKPTAQLKGYSNLRPKGLWAKYEI